MCTFHGTAARHHHLGKQTLTRLQQCSSGVFSHVPRLPLPPCPASQEMNLCSMGRDPDFHNLSRGATISPATAFKVRFRAIAPRPVSSSDDTPSDCMAQTGDATENLSGERKSCKRRTVDSALGRPSKRVLLSFGTSFLSHYSLLEATAVMDPESRLRALEGTPLGKLLKNTPDIHYRMLTLSQRSTDVDSSSQASTPSTPIRIMSSNSPFTSPSPVNSCHSSPLQLSSPAYLRLPSRHLFPTPFSTSLAPQFPALVEVDSQLPPEAHPARTAYAPALTEPRSTCADHVIGSAAGPLSSTDIEPHLLWANPAFEPIIGCSVGQHGSQIRLHISGYPDTLPATHRESESKPSQHLMTFALHAIPPSAFLPCPDRKVMYAYGRMQNSSTVFCPQPIRSIGSAVRMSCAHTAPKSASVSVEGSYADVEARYDALDQCSTPVLLTDSTGKVRWVNSAYKLLTDQPRCSWLLVTGNRGGATQRLMGEVVVEGLEDMPLDLPALACTAEVKWSGKKRLILPALGIRLEGNVRLGFIWHLNTSAAGLHLRESG